ncbi:hypothetical protein BT67DRAFT_11526 [Trichocladium antarcticum]|uniref:Uncharacterized protein n=1 Tax=Trichocladium antarcticum TaxID=1450529 RepID=A0AAN6USN2_9PEZI|nr:hypothetical protein BT67DRAFT_11526 [Trichocladium antarcticum]
MAMQRTASSSLKHAGMINKDVTTASTTQPGLVFARSPGTRVPGKGQTSPMPCHSRLPMQPRDLHTIVDGVIPVPRCTSESCTRSRPVGLSFFPGIPTTPSGAKTRRSSFFYLARLSPRTRSRQHRSGHLAYYRKPLGVNRMRPRAALICWQSGSVPPVCPTAGPSPPPLSVGRDTL